MGTSTFKLGTTLVIYLIPFKIYIFKIRMLMIVLTPILQCETFNDLRYMTQIVKHSFSLQWWLITFRRAQF